MPPPASHNAAELLILHRVPVQSASVRHAIVGFFRHVPAAVSHFPGTGTWQVTKPALPQIERAAQWVTLPLSS
jgi:hypothetical protein